MQSSYGTDSIAYLRRARQRLDEATREALFYAAFELRCGTETRLQDYLDAREDIAKHRKRGWKIMDSAKELDRVIRLGDKIAEVCFLDGQGRTAAALYYTPITDRLRAAAGGRLQDLVHAMKKPYLDDDRWWSDTRAFLEQIYSALFVANRGTLLGPMMRAPDGKHFYVSMCIRNDSPIADKVDIFSKVGANATIRIKYYDSLPDHATPFLNPIDA